MPRVNAIDDLSFLPFEELTCITPDQFAALSPGERSLFDKLQGEGKVTPAENGDLMVAVPRRARTLVPRFVEEEWDDPAEPYFVETDKERIKEWHKILRKQKQKLHKKYGLVLPKPLHGFWATPKRTKLVITSYKVVAPPETAQ